jgi:acyl-CoA thioesterase-1
MFPEVAKEENVQLIPFLLEGVAGDTSLNLPDGIHPSEEGHRIVAETVWEYLRPLL